MASLLVILMQLKIEENVKRKVVLIFKIPIQNMRYWDIKIKQLFFFFRLNDNIIERKTIQTNKTNLLVF